MKETLNKRAVITSSPVWRAMSKVLRVMGNKYFLPMLFSFGGCFAGIYFAFTYDFSIITAALIGFGLGFIAWLIIVIMHIFE